MRLGRLFELAIAAGRRADPRRDAVREFADSAILYGKKDRQVHSVLVGIDIDVQEILLADRLKASRHIDCVISHHPSGHAYAGLYRVMDLQAQLLESAGLDAASARGFLEERKAEVERKILPQNHMRAVDAARLLDIPFVCMHTPADNLAARFVERLLSEQRPRRVRDVITVLSGVAEYKQAAAAGTGPRIVLGASERECGKVFVEMTGGAEGPKGAYRLLRTSGIGTIISMHMSEDHLKAARSAGLNAVIAGHMSSDTLGMNLLLDEIERGERLDITCCSGFSRTRR
ncbi:MAG: NGG1p interacting factor NIF3 [Deltaproteobacteria bacterium]